MSIRVLHRICLAGWLVDRLLGLRLRVLLLLLMAYSHVRAVVEVIFLLLVLLRQYPLVVGLRSLGLLSILLILVVVLTVIVLLIVVVLIPIIIALVVVLPIVLILVVVLLLVVVGIRLIEVLELVRGPGLFLVGVLLLDHTRYPLWLCNRFDTL